MASALVPAGRSVAALFTLVTSAFTKLTLQFGGATKGVYPGTRYPAVAQVEADQFFQAPEL